ncbi:unnamed protein product [Symbiodinium natans]|uniref:Uncharacterized protein n=1 Tax=Symbiodinium natans TaxID=878477 RepID=A0A812K158_9DINO|nr:unnamed protein product [Symbiodinium natans]
MWYFSGGMSCPAEMDSVYWCTVRVLSMPFTQVAKVLRPSSLSSGLCSLRSFSKVPQRAAMNAANLAQTLLYRLCRIVPWPLVGMCCQGLLGRGALPSGK